MKKIIAAVLLAAIVGLFLFSEGKKELPATAPEPIVAATPTAPAQPSEAAIPQPERRKDIARLVLLRACYESEKCDFPQTDPRSYHFAVGQAINAELAAFQEKYRHDPEARRELETIARDELANLDANVQSFALKILAGFPPAEENLKTITEALHNNPDAAFVGEAMDEFKRYLGSPWEQQLHQSLSELV